MTIFSFYMSVQPGIESLPMAEPTAGWSRWPRHYLWPAHIKMMLATLDCLPLAVTIFTTSTSVSFKQLCTGGMSIVVNAEGWGEGGERRGGRDPLTTNTPWRDSLIMSPALPALGLEPTISFKSDQSCFDLVFSWEILPTVPSLLRAQTRDSCNHSHSISWQ